ncbi:hypothetical protein [Aeromonas sanarellii]|uniref:hypothetical protein n=1 Tax=Aeromonas sanarellii TaxID=633415 RepID=UPI0038D20C49
MRFPTQSFVDKIAAGLNMINTADTSKAEEIQDVYLDIVNLTAKNLKDNTTADVNKFGGVNEAIENPVKPVLWLEPDSSVSASAVWAAAKGTDIPVEEILNCRDGVTMTALREYFEVKVKTAKEI